MKNTVYLIGNIGNELKISQTTYGKTALFFSIAIDESYKDKEGKKVELVEWFSLACYDKTAELIAKHFKKGDQIAIVGKLKNNSYTTQEGQKIYKVQVLINEIVWQASKCRENKNEEAH